MHSFDLAQQWKEGVSRDQLFERACFLSNLLRREEYLQQRIESSKPEFFDQVLQFMIDKRVIVPVDQNKIVLRTSGESQIIFIRSLIFPVVDTYYVSLIFVLTFIKNKGVAVTRFLKSVQWLAELQYKQGALEFFESCNQESMKNAMASFIERGILVKTGGYVELNDKFSEDEPAEGKLVELLQLMSKFRQKPRAGGERLTLSTEDSDLLRRSMMAQFPFMAKL